MALEDSARRHVSDGVFLGQKPSAVSQEREREGGRERGRERVRRRDRKRSRYGEMQREILDRFTSIMDTQVNMAAYVMKIDSNCNLFRSVVARVAESEAWTATVNVILRLQSLGIFPKDFLHKEGVGDVRIRMVVFDVRPWIPISGIFIQDTYIHIYIYIHTYIHTYIYIYRERERCIYIYIYIYIYRPIIIYIIYYNMT